MVVIKAINVTVVIIRLGYQSMKLLNWWTLELLGLLRITKICRLISRACQVIKEGRIENK